MICHQSSCTDSGNKKIISEMVFVLSALRGIGIHFDIFFQIKTTEVG